MIIKSLVEFAELRSKSVEFQCKSDLDWLTFNADYSPLCDIEGYIEEGQLRTMPETVTLYEYKSECNIELWVSSSHEPQTLILMSGVELNLTGRVIRNGVIEESDNG